MIEDQQNVLTFFILFLSSAHPATPPFSTDICIVLTFSNPI